MASNRRHKGGHHEEEHENEERWLVSFADMMTLLFALFMVLFSISSVNTSKYEELQKSLHDAFSGAILSGGKSVMTTGSDASETKQASPKPPLPALRPVTSLNTTQPKNADEAQKAAQKEENDFRALKRRIDNLSEEAGRGWWMLSAPNRTVVATDEAGEFAGLGLPRRGDGGKAE